MKKSTLWPIGITATYVLFVIGMFAFIIFSFSVNTDLVENDYYQKGLDYQQQINRIKNTRQLAQSIQFSYDKQNNDYVITAPANSSLSAISGVVVFFRPSDKTQDKRIPLRFDSNGVFRYSLSGFSKGYWRIKIFWNIGQNEYFNEDSLYLK